MKLREILRKSFYHNNLQNLRQMSLRAMRLSVYATSSQGGHGWRKSFWTPRVTLLTFLLQVLDGAKSLRSAVSLLLVHWVDRGEEDLPSCDPSAFCQARQRLPCAVVNGAMVAVANRMRHMLPLLLIPARCQTAKAFALLRHLWAWIAHDIVPDRYEPRRLKRRAKQYTYLVKLRAEYKNLAATGAC